MLYQREDQMPKNLSQSQNHRQKIGNHTAWLDKSQGTQRMQNDRVQRLSRQPGLNSTNAGQQHATQAMVQLLGILSSAQISNANPAITLQPNENTQSNSTQASYANNGAEIRKIARPNPSRYVRAIPNHFASARATSSVTTPRYLPQALPRMEGSTPADEWSGNGALVNQLGRGPCTISFDYSSSKNTICQIFALTEDNHFHWELRKKLEDVFRSAYGAPEVLQAPEADKNVYMLLKCIHQMQFFIIKYKQMKNGPEMLSRLIKLGDDLETMREKEIFSRFKDKFSRISTLSGNLACELPLPDKFSPKMHVPLKLLSSENIPCEIAFLGGDPQFDYELRVALLKILQESYKDASIKQTGKEQKNLKVLMRCLHELQLLIIKNNCLSQGKPLLDELFKVADNLSTKEESDVFKQFTLRFKKIFSLSEKATCEPAFYPSFLEDIPCEIAFIINDPTYTVQSREVLNMIAAKSPAAPEVRHALKGDKNLLLLLKTIQQMHFYVMGSPFSKDGKVLLSNLIKIADNLNSAHQKDIVQQFKEKYLSKEATDSVVKMPNFNVFTITQGKYFVGDMLVFTSLDEDRIIWAEQTRHLNKMLEENQVDILKSPPLIQINKLIHYITGKGKHRMDEVIKQLLKPVSMRDSDQGAYLTDGRKKAVLAWYLNYAILGMSFEQWLVNQLQATGLSNQTLVTYKYIELRLNQQLNLKSLTNVSIQKRVLSLEAQKFYRLNVLNTLLPLPLISLNDKETKEIYSMDVTQPRWGFIYAGAKLFNDTEIEFNGLTLSDFEDAGFALHAMLHEKTIPSEYASYFRLPALIYNVKAGHLRDTSKFDEQELVNILTIYFNYINDKENENNPILQLPRLINEWKTRTGLAQVIMRDKQISVNLLYSYMNSHKQISLEGKIVPNVDEVFVQQNNKLAYMASEVDKMSLVNLFDSLSESEQKFIEQAKVDRVGVRFSAIGNAYPDVRFPGAHIVDDSGVLVRADKLICPISDAIDFIHCSYMGQERMYAIENPENSSNYTIKRVDFNREVLLNFLEDAKTICRNKCYKLELISPVALKQPADSPAKLIENLANLHKQKLLNGLYNSGYDKTTQEEVEDFLLSLIPFYTCVQDIKKGNRNQAILNCGIDTLSLVFPAAKAIQVGTRFGNALGKVSVMAVRYGIRQKTIQAMVKQGGKEFIKYSPLISKEVSPNVMRGQGVSFLRGLDPGFELLALGGKQGIHSLQKVLAKIDNKSRGLIRLSKALKNKVSATANTKNLKIESVVNAADGKKFDVAMIGVAKGQKIWSQINRETGDAFSNYYIRNAQGKLESINIEMRHQKHHLAKNKGKPKKLGYVQDSENIMPDVDKYKMIGPGILGKFSTKNKYVVKRRIAASHYIHYYTNLPNKPQRSKVLVVTAHGGYYNMDTASYVNPVMLPPNLTIKMLTPHGTVLIDPGLGSVVNAGDNLKAYLTIDKGMISNVDFLPQQGHSGWHYSQHYNPENIYSTFGREDGLQNYRHMKYEKDNDRRIAEVLMENRKSAEKGEAALADVLAVDKYIKDVDDTSLKDASVQKVIDLFNEGKLANEYGEPYETIVFSHCRGDLSQFDELDTIYYMEPKQLQNRLERDKNRIKRVPTASREGEIVLTMLHRDDISKEFTIKKYSFGHFIFTPVKLSKPLNSTVITTD